MSDCEQSPASLMIHPPGIAMMRKLSRSSLVLLMQILERFAEEIHPAGLSACDFRYAETFRLSVSRYATMLRELEKVHALRQSEDQSLLWINAEFFGRVWKV